MMQIEVVEIGCRKGTIVFFNGNEPNARFDMSVRRRGTLQFTPKYSTLSIWWFAHDRSECGICLALQGTAAIKLAHLEVGKKHHIELCTLRGKPVGVITLRLREGSVVPSDVRDSDAAWSVIEPYVAEGDARFAQAIQTVAQLHEHRAWESNAIEFPINVSKPLPRWALIWDATFGPNNVPHSTLVQLFECAKRRLRTSFRYDPRNASLAQAMEVVAEMAALPARTCAYRIDHQDKQVADQWTSLTWFPDMLEAGIDCEDCEESVWRILYSLMRNPPVPLAPLRDALLNYRLLFCLGTLRYDENCISYHAFIIGVDHEWFRDALTDKATASPSSTRYGAPFLLIEGTSYTTSVWSLESDVKEKPMWEPTNPNVHGKLGAIGVQKEHAYLHLVTAFAPDLIDELGCADVYFYNGDDSLGVAIPDVAAYSSSVRVVPGPRVTQEVKEAVASIVSERFPPSKQWPSYELAPLNEQRPPLELYYVRDRFEDTDAILYEGKLAACHHHLVQRRFNATGMLELAIYP